MDFDYKFQPAAFGFFLENFISGDLLESLKEVETIQKSLRSKKISTDTAEISKRFFTRNEKRERQQHYENSYR